MSRTADAARAALQGRSPQPGPERITSERRRASMIALAALIAVLVGAGPVASRGSESSPAGELPVAVPQTASPAQVTGTSGIPQSGPPADWRLWSSGITRIALPTVTGAGPLDPSAPVGFADTPTGALVAAANLVPQIWFGTDMAAWQQLADRSVLWGDGAREDLARRRRAAIAGAPPAAQPMAIAGFRYIYFRGTEAQLRLWLRGPVNTLGMNVRLVRADGDWKVAWDESAADIRVLAAEESFIPWKAVS